MALVAKREKYLEKLISLKWNSSAKVVTGIRRSGKSFLLFNLFVNHLIEEKVPKDHIIAIDLESRENIKLRDPDNLYNAVVEKATDGDYYVLIDEIQFVEDFESVINGFLRKGNLDVYITGSNSKFLSKDIITEFRGRTDEIRIRSYSFKEFLSVYDGNESDAWNEYVMYGGMPECVNRKTHEEKERYLNNLVETVYLKDIIERNKIKYESDAESMFDFLCSSIGSLVNSNKISNTMKTEKKSDISNDTVKKYMGCFENAFLFEQAKRYDVKGKKYMSYPSKYYVADIGLRNARLNFRQQGIAHITENIIFNELRSRGFSVDVGLINVVENGKGKQLEIDFVVNKGYQRYYIQSAFAASDKMESETRAFGLVDDSFKKILLTFDDGLPWKTEKGILVLNVKQFLLDEKAMDI